MSFPLIIIGAPMYIFWLYGETAPYVGHYFRAKPPPVSTEPRKI